MMTRLLIMGWTLGSVSCLLSMTLTCIIIVQTPCLDEVLGQLGVSQQLHSVRHQLHVALRKPQQLEIHPADLGVKWVVVEQVGAVKCFAVCLVHCDYVLLAIKYLNLLLYKC